jgi:hypothetical protein
VVLDSVSDVVTHIEVENLRRASVREGGGNPVDMPWLFAMASPGSGAEELQRALYAGAESLILGVVLDGWPYGITCSIDSDGRITGLSGEHPPPWVGHQLPTLTLAEAEVILLSSEPGHGE